PASSALPSVERSSTMMSSNVGRRWASTLSIAGFRNAPPLNTGISTDTSGTMDLGPDFSPLRLMLGDREAGLVHFRRERVACVLHEMGRIAEREEPELVSQRH